MNRKQLVGSASEERLEKLIRERLKPGADKARIDERIWDLFGEEWCIMFTDLSGFSRNVAKFGITHFLQTIYESQRILIPIIDDYDGILIKVEGDSFLIIFRTIRKGMKCAMAMQRKLKVYNVDKPEEEKVLLCVGLGYGKILRIGDTDVYGAEVNAASKLGEDTADPWEILITNEVYERIRESKGFSFDLIDDTPPGAEGAYKVNYSL